MASFHFVPHTRVPNKVGPDQPKDNHYRKLDWPLSVAAHFFRAVDFLIVSLVWVTVFVLVLLLDLNLAENGCVVPFTFVLLFLLDWSFDFNLSEKRCASVLIFSLLLSQCPFICLTRCWVCWVPYFTTSFTKPVCFAGTLPAFLKYRIARLVPAKVTVYLAGVASLYIR